MVRYATIFDKILWKRDLVGNKLAQPSISVRDFIKIGAPEKAAVITLKFQQCTLKIRTPEKFL